MAGHSKMADDFSLSRVPSEARVPMWEILVIRIGAFTSLSQFILGAFLGYGMSFWDAALASFLGMILLEVITLLIGIAGSREGLSTSMLSRWTGFGKYGSSLIGVVIAVATIGWFGVQNSVFANGINDALGGALGFPLAATLTGLFVTVIVIFGFKWLGMTAKIAVPGFLLAVAYGIYHIFESQSLTALMTSPAPGPALTLGAAATMVAGSFMVGAVLTPDMTRYCRNSKDVLWSTLISVVVGEIIINLIAVLMAHAVKTSDVVTIALQTSGWLDAGRYGLEGKNPAMRLRMLWFADRALRVMFQTYAKAIGLHDYHLPDMDEVARVAHDHYNNHLRGGEGHMEVGKLILNVAKRKVNMTLSVKPFGCMPSSGVSDGVQSLITEKYPEAIFLPIETTGDGAINVYSRVQMMLFKAKQAAQKEFDEALAKKGVTADQLRNFVPGSVFARPLQTSPHVVASTAANAVYSINKYFNGFSFRRNKRKTEEVPQ